jgi:SAM-dependent methyltransferase
MKDIPLPPPKLMYKINGQKNAEIFRNSRIGGVEQLQNDLLNSGIDILELNNVLDCGCGCGRIIAGWELIGHRFVLNGCDYNKKAINWCRSNIPGVDFKINSIDKPLPYEDGRFDLIYLLSVFTHLSSDTQISMIREFRRILKPDGYVYLTFHGKYFQPDMIKQVHGGNSIFSEKGMLINKEKKQGSNDCWVLHKKEKLQEMFETTGFRFINHFDAIVRGPTHLAGWQDSILFRLKSDTA